MLILWNSSLFVSPPSGRKQSATASLNVEVKKRKKQNETDLNFSHGRLQTTFRPQYRVKVHKNITEFGLSQKLGFELMTSISFRSRLQPWIWHSEPSQPPAPVALQYFSMIQKCQLKADSARLVYFFPANCNPISLFRRVTAVFAVVLEQAAAVRAIVRITPTLLRETNWAEWKVWDRQLQ